MRRDGERRWRPSAPWALHPRVAARVENTSGGLSAPAGAVENRLAVRCEHRRLNAADTKGQLSGTSARVQGAVEAATRATSRSLHTATASAAVPRTDATNRRRFVGERRCRRCGGSTLWWRLRRRRPDRERSGSGPRELFSRQRRTTRSSAGRHGGTGIERVCRVLAQDRAQRVGRGRPLERPLARSASRSSTVPNEKRSER